MVYPLHLLAAPLFVKRPAGLALLILPLVHNRGRRPVLTLADHFVYGAGVLAQLNDHLRTIRGINSH